MTETLDDMLREILDEVATEAEKHDCIVALYIFGSMVRGDHTPTSDLDLAVDYPPLDEMARCEWIGDSYEVWQAASVEWRVSFGQRIGRTVNIDRLHIGDPESEAWPVIVEARKRPVAVKGKALVVWTPPTQKG